MTAILIDEIHASRSCFLKLGARRHLVISIVMVAGLIATNERGEIVEARLAVGAASAVAQRLNKLERRLIGRAANASIIEVVQPDDFTDLSPIDDLRATSSYRRDAAEELVRRALVRLIGDPHG